jgi:hypothetical protein
VQSHNSQDKTGDPHYGHIDDIGDLDDLDSLGDSSSCSDDSESDMSHSLSSLMSSVLTHGATTPNPNSDDTNRQPTSMNMSISMSNSQIESVGFDLLQDRERDRGIGVRAADSRSQSMVSDYSVEDTLSHNNVHIDNSSNTRSSYDSSFNRPKHGSSNIPSSITQNQRDSTHNNDGPGGRGGHGGHYQKGDF